ncbi:MAG: ABC transporter permease [Sterolibacterium sp.]|nr:ABC transporter permease [Sterolibacterium sp.]
MALPLSYCLRNLATRKLTTFLTAGAMALVVFVFAAVLMLDAGLRQTLVDTGSEDNVIAIRKGSGTEMQSGIDRASAAIMESQPQVALGPDGKLVSSKETVVLITLPKRQSGSVHPANVTVRGIGGMGLALRPQVKLAQGRMFRSGSYEVVAGSSLGTRFQGAGLGETLRFGNREWTVVGVLDAGKTGFDSEIWGDSDQLMPAFRRPVFSSVTLRLADREGFDTLKRVLESDPRLTIEVKRERQYYADQSELMANFIRILGLTLSIIFSIGAVIGAMITMYASVASRTGEIGTLRALGFRRRSVLGAFLVESLMLALIGGLVGLILASLMQLVTISTMNFQSFAELAFSFQLTPRIVFQTLLFALAMGFIGGFLPAARAARMNIVTALRAA